MYCFTAHVASPPYLQDCISLFAGTPCPLLLPFTATRSLQGARTALEAAQQAAAAAASRSALRQRHQQQLASLLGSDSRPVHSSSLRRALLGERLADQVGAGAVC
jgi:hypothetical protein